MVTRIAVRKFLTPDHVNQVTFSVHVHVCYKKQALKYKFSIQKCFKVRKLSHSKILRVKVLSLKH